MSAEPRILRWHLTRDVFRHRYPKLTVKPLPSPKDSPLGSEVIVQLPNHKEIWTVGHTPTGELGWLGRNYVAVLDRVSVIRWAWTKR